jgi:transcriptional regulator with XRE-family HTH domain
MRPSKLAIKLLKIRNAFGCTQDEMCVRLKTQNRKLKQLTKQHISSYENGHREPSILVLLAYARIAGVNMELIVDDRLILPDGLPVELKHKVIE